MVRWFQDHTSALSVSVQPFLFSLPVPLYLPPCPWPSPQCEGMNTGGIYEYTGMVGSHWERLGLGGRVEGGVKAKWSVHKLMLIRLSADGGQTGWEEHLLTTCSPSAHTSSPGGRGGVEVGGVGVAQWVKVRPMAVMALCVSMCMNCSFNSIYELLSPSPLYESLQF